MGMALIPSNEKNEAVDDDDECAYILNRSSLYMTFINK